MTARRRPLRAVIYVRLSRHRGADDPSTSPERQREACQSYAEAQGWEVVEVVEDLNVSGSDKGLRLDRPGLQGIRALWGRVDVVLFLKIDRLARNVVDFATFAEEARDNGAALVSVRDGLDLTTPSGRFVATILAAFAEMEAATIAERVREGVRAVRLAGRWGGGGAPYGYRIVPNPNGPGKVLAIEPNEAAVIREAAEAILAGDPLGRAVRRLNEAGVKPRRTDAWSRITLRQVLLGDAALGRATVGGEVLRDGDGEPVQTWPPILTLAEAKGLRAALDPVADARKSLRHDARLLSGFLVCHSCGGRLQVSRRTDGSVTYRCQTRSDGGLCAAQVVVSAPAVEAWAEDFYLRRFGRLPETRIERAGPSAAEEAARLDDLIAFTLASLGKEATAEGFARLQDLQVQRTALADAGAEEPELREVLTGRSKADAWAEGDVEDRRLMLRRDLPDVFVIGPGRRGPRGFDPARIVDLDLDAFPSPEDYGLGGSRGVEPGPPGGHLIGNGRGRGGRVTK